MNPLQEPERNNVAQSIAAVREAWLDALKAGDAARLGAMVTDDIVVVHGNGRCIRGKDELENDFRKGFEVFSIEQNVSPVEVVVRGGRAFEIAEVVTTITPQAGGDARLVHSTTVVVLNRQADGSYKVSRVLGLLDPA
jgi:uncharacterized protein (TIGR02246 family)